MNIGGFFFVIVIICAIISTKSIFKVFLMIQKQHLSESINGKRVSLKRFSIDLAEQMYRYIDEDRERLSIFLPWANSIQKVEDEIDFINKRIKEWEDYENLGFGIFRNDDGEYLGNVSAFNLNWSSHHLEFGYWILGKFEGQGYMSEAVSLLEQALRTIGFNRMVIRCDSRNQRSASIPKRLGYKFEGIQRQAKLYDDGYHDLEVFSKVGSDLSK